MADLGTLQTYSGLDHNAIVIALWSEKPTIYFDRSGSLSVSIKVAGVIKPYARSALYHSPTNNLVAVVKADENGDATFSQLDKSDIYYVVATDVGTYNALIYDKLTPV